MSDVMLCQTDGICDTHGRFIYYCAKCAGEAVWCKRHSAMDTCYREDEA
jgi:hypothetical protein